MQRQHGEYISRFFDHWMPITARHSGWIIVIALVMAGLSLLYTVGHLAIDTDTAGMISSDLPFKRAYEEYKKKFPQIVDTLLVVIDGPTEESLYRAVSEVTEFVNARDDLFVDAYVPGGGEFFDTNKLLFADVDDLEALTDRLAGAQPFIAILARNPDLTGLVELLNGAFDTGDPEMIGQVEPIMQGFDETLVHVLKGDDTRLSWLGMMGGDDTTGDLHQQFVIVRPRMDFDEMMPAAASIDALTTMIGDSHIDSDHGFRVRFTGEVALAEDELSTISTGATRAMLLAFLMVGLALWKALGSPRLVIASVITLILGIIFTTTFAAIAIGRLNMISMAFAVLYIGLSVDYSIHFCLRYRELRGRRHSHVLALRYSAVDIGPSLILCAISTAIGFYAFIPTSFIGVSELGVIAGTGMFISLILNLTLLPALMTLLKSPQKISTRSNPPGTHPIADPVIRFMTRRRLTIRYSAVVLTAFASVCILRISFDADPINLRDPHSESVSTLNEMMDSGKLKPWSASVLAGNEEEATRIAAEMEPLKVVDQVIDINTFIPEDQEEKIAVIDDLNLIMGPIPEIAADSTAPPVDEQIAALRSFVNMLSVRDHASDGAVDRVAERLGAHVQEFLDRINGEPPVDAEILLERLNGATFGELPTALDTIGTMLEAAPFTVADLPEAVRSRWVSVDGRYRVEVVPSEDLRDTAALRRFVDEVRTVSPNATGSAVSIMESGNTVVYAFQEAIGGALIAIVVVLLIVLRDVRKVILILIPLTAAAIMAGAATVVFDLSFNFANVMALPLLLGVGVDNGIHIVQRAKGHAAAATVVFHTSTARAVFYSALTTILSFGNLAFMAHRGISSMGMILSLGILFMLYTTLVVLPSIMAAPVEGAGG